MANRILLLEDDSTLRGQLMTLLSDRGLIVDSYADGESGFQRGLEGHFDVAIIDLGLPKTPGLELSLIHISEPTRPLYISYAVFCLRMTAHCAGSS